MPIQGLIHESFPQLCLGQDQVSYDSGPQLAVPTSARGRPVQTPDFEQPVPLFQGPRSKYLLSTITKETDHEFPQTGVLSFAHSFSLSLTHPPQIHHPPFQSPWGPSFLVMPDPGGHGVVLAQIFFKREKRERERQRGRAEPSVPQAGPSLTPGLGAHRSL